MRLQVFRGGKCVWEKSIDNFSESPLEVLKRAPKLKRLVLDKIEQYRKEIDAQKGEELYLIIPSRYEG